MPQLIVLVVDQVKVFPAVLEAWEEAGRCNEPWRKNS